MLTWLLYSARRQQQWLTYASYSRGGMQPTVASLSNADEAMASTWLATSIHYKPLSHYNRRGLCHPTFVIPSQHPDYGCPPVSSKHGEALLNV